MTGALAGLAFEGETLFRRLTDLDPGALPPPAASRASRARPRPRRGERFRAYFPQELGHYVAEVVLDTLAGLARRDRSENDVKEIFFPKRMWRPRGELKRRYDVVIVGGGSHGLATAYYLAKHHGVKDVCILEKSYIGSGASGRNTTIVRANYRTPEGAEFYGASVRLYERLSEELDFNLMFSQRGHLTLAHSDRALVVMQERAEVNKLLGIESSVIGPTTDRELCPELDLSDRPDVADPRGALPPAGRDHPPRRRRVGVRARAPIAAASRSTRTPR